MFGNDAAEASRLRWDWQYRRNPNNPAAEPEIWIAREGPAIVGQYATMPVRLSLRGRKRVRARGAWTSWSRRSGSGRASAKCCSAPGIATSARRSASGSRNRRYRLFQKLRWPDVGPVPCFVKPLTRRALRRPNWPVGRQPARLGRHAARREGRRADPAAPRRSPADPALRRQLHRAVGVARAEVRLRGPARRRVPELEVRQRAARPLLDRGAAARRPQRRLRRLPAPAGAARPRHAARRLPRRSGRPRRGSRRCCGWIDREARQADSDKIRAFAMHAGFRRSCASAPATSRSSRRWSSSSRSTRSTCRRRSTTTPTAGTSRWAVDEAIAETGATRRRTSDG